MPHIAKFIISADKRVHTNVIAQLSGSALSNLSLHATHGNFHEAPSDNARYIIMDANQRATVLGVSFMLEAPSRADLDTMVTQLKLPQYVNVQYIDLTQTGSP